MNEHIHIVGCSPRSGTTLLHEMMVTCFQIEHHCDHEASLYEFTTPTAGIACTKHPKEVVYMNGALHASRNLYVLYLVRDPRDVIVSSHGNHPGQYFIGLSFYLLAEKFAARMLNHPRFLAIRYEDLVHAPDVVQEKIIERMPFLKKTHAFSEFHLFAKVSKDSAIALNQVRPLDIKSIGRWRGHATRIAEQFRRHPKAQQILRKYGYEPDEKWLTALPSANNDQPTESVKREHFGMKYELQVMWRGARRNLRYWIRTRCNNPEST